MHATLKDFFLQLHHKKSQPSFDIVLPFHGHTNELEQELVFFSRPIYAKSEKLFICEPLKSKPWFAQDWWPDSKILEPENYVKLKEMPNWGSFYYTENSKFEKKIRQSLKNLDLKRIHWAIPHPFHFKFTAWTLAEDRILYCQAPHHRFPFGWHEFEEDKENPPNRAYLKLWEVLLVYFDQFGITYEQLRTMNCLEVGASPGGWTWILAKLFKKVYAIDRSELAPKVAQHKNIHFKSADAFALKPSDYPDVQWFFSDLICTPEKLQECILKWVDQSRVEFFVCTFKFKGDVRFEVLQSFHLKMTQLGSSSLHHLYHNKNEVTWLFKRSLA